MLALHFILGLVASTSVETITTPAPPGPGFFLNLCPRVFIGALSDPFPHHLATICTSLSALKLDFAKAYDTLDRRFLSLALRRHGFTSTLVRAVEQMHLGTSTPSMYLGCFVSFFTAIRSPSLEPLRKWEPIET
jgi:hypothetical protein